VQPEEGELTPALTADRGSDTDRSSWQSQWTEGGLQRIQEETAFSNAQWLRIREVLPEWRNRDNLLPEQEAALERELRGIADAISYTIAVGRLRDLPEGYPQRETVANYSDRWGVVRDAPPREGGVWAAVNAALPDPELNAGLDELGPTNAGGQNGSAAQPGPAQPGPAPAEPAQSGSGAGHTPADARRGWERGDDGRPQSRFPQRDFPAEGERLLGSRREIPEGDSSGGALSSDDVQEPLPPPELLSIGQVLEPILGSQVSPQRVADGRFSDVQEPLPPSELLSIGQVLEPTPGSQVSPQHIEDGVRIGQTSEERDVRRAQVLEDLRQAAGRASSERSGSDQGRDSP
jgi:hypothetical protein